jgi:hypothetical protein
MKEERLKVEIKFKGLLETIKYDRGGTDGTKEFCCKVGTTFITWPRDGTGLNLESSK